MALMLECCNVALRLKSSLRIVLCNITLRGRPFNSWDGGGVGDFEKKIPASACGKKNAARMQHKCNKKLMGKKGKKISCPPARKKNLDDQKSPTPTPLKS